MKNSIQKAYSNIQKTATVVSHLRHPDNKNKLLVLVEGVDDVYFFSHIVKLTSVTLLPQGGCESIEYVVEKLNVKYYSKILAIRDADFKRANNEPRRTPNIFWTDYHDIEMMQLCSGGAKHMCDKYCYGNYHSSVIDDIQNELVNVSYVRWFNQIRHDVHGQVGICFDHLPICNTIYDAGSVIDLNTYWPYLESMQTHVLSCHKEDVEKFISTHSRGVELKQITNGHEAISALWCKINLYYKHNLKKVQLAREICDYYTIDLFKRSELYHEIQDWRTKNNIVLEVFAA